jgi:signal transduction histidine kinase
MRGAVAVAEEVCAALGHELKPLVEAARLQATLAQGRLRDNGDPAEASDIVDSINKEVARLDGVITRVVRLVATRGGDVVLRREKVDLAELIPRITRQLLTQRKIEEGDLPLRTRLEGELTGRWDPSALEEVMLNLIDNAIKFGSGAPIAVTARGTGPIVTIVVRDHGIGISPADLPRIFGWFERAVAPGAYPGLGLGLWIVQELVRAHGGSVTAFSVPEKGSLFRVRLPRG